MRRTHIKPILLLLTLTVSAALLHEVIVHDNATCTVCVQFHSSPPAIDNNDIGSLVIIGGDFTLPISSSQQVVFTRPTQTRSIRAPPAVLIKS